MTKITSIGYRLSFRLAALFLISLLLPRLVCAMDTVERLLLEDDRQMSLEKNQNTEVAPAENFRPGLYVGNTREGAACAIHIEKIESADFQLSATPKDLTEKDVYETLTLGQAREVLANGQVGNLVKGLWQGQVSIMAHANVGSALQVTLDEQKKPLGFVYASNIFPTALIIKYRTTHTGRIVAPPFVEIICENLK